MKQENKTKGVGMKKLMMLAMAIAVAMPLMADTETVGAYTWTYYVIGETATIYKDYGRAVSPSPTGAITIPSTLGGKPVTSIGFRAFEYCSGLTSVTIPDSVTSIGNYAFYGCSGLTSIAVGAGNPNYASVNGLLLSKDEKMLIQGINGNVTIPNSVTNIGSFAFFGRSGLTSVTIPYSVTSIGDDAFTGCSGLTSVTIPDSVTSIGSDAFSECSGLKSVTIPQCVCDKRLSNFFGVYDNYGECICLVTNVVISDSVTSIGDRAFLDCSSLASVTIPDGVTIIGASAFANCSSLRCIKLPSNLVSIGGNAFNNTAAYSIAQLRPLVTADGVLGGSWTSESSTGSASSGGSSPGGYALSETVGNSTITSMTVSADTSIDSFLLADGQVFDMAIRIVNVAESAVRLSLPSDYDYETIGAADPLAIPASSTNMVTITRTAAKTFLVSRQQLRAVR